MTRVCFDSANLLGTEATRKRREAGNKSSEKRESRVREAEGFGQTYIEFYGCRGNISKFPQRMKEQPQLKLSRWIEVKWQWYKLVPFSLKGFLIFVIVTINLTSFANIFQIKTSNLNKKGYWSRRDNMATCLSKKYSIYLATVHNYHTFWKYITINIHLRVASYNLSTNIYWSFYNFIPLHC